MSWCHFQPGEKKKGSKRQPREAKKESLVTDDLEQDVDECVTEMFSQASQELMKFLTNSQGNQQEIRTAVVCCSFPHVDIFRKALGTGLKTTIFPINKDSQVRNVIETARQSKLAGVFLIEQIESLSSEFIENLLYLSQWFELQHSFVICTSTGVSSFSDICSFDTLKSINAEIFNMPRPEDIYTQVIKCLLKKCQADRIHLSGEVLSLLRSRYFCNSFSVEEMKKTIRICVKHHNWQVDQSKSVPNRKDFEALVEGYWRNLEYYTTTVNADLFKCHEEIQTGTFKAPKQMSAIAVSEWIELDSVPAEIRKEVKTHLVSYFQRKADDSAKESEMDTSTNVTASSKQRFTNTELKKQLEQQRTAMLVKKQSRPELLLEHACKTIVDKLLCSWKNFPQSDQFLIRDEPKKVLYCDPAALVENALLLETNKNEPLSAAFRGLQQRSNWKSTKISGWLKNYESEYVTSNKENTTPSFFAALGQLESMGVVKASFERSKDSVTVLHHPISHVLN